MQRAVSLAWHYFRLAVMNELQYRLNFFIQLLESAIALVTALVVLALVYSHTDTLGGWNRYELQSLLGVYTVLMAVIRVSMQPNIERLIGDIHQGNFDFVLTKPMDAQWQVSIREVRVWQLIDVVAGLLIMGDAVWRLGRQISLWQAGLFGVTLLLGIAILYAVWMLIGCIAFWAIRIDNVFELFDNVASAGRLPVTIYPGWMRIILTYIVPMDFAVTVPAEVITARVDLATVGVQAVVALGFLGLLRIVWRWSLTQDSGASAEGYIFFSRTEPAEDTEAFC